MRIDYRLKDALTWRFVVVAFLPLLIVGLLFFDYFYRDTKARRDRENRSLAESFASQISLQLREPNVLLREFPLIYSRLSESPELLTQLLDDIVAEANGLDSLFLVNRQGEVWAAGLPDNLHPYREAFIEVALPIKPLLKAAERLSGLAWSESSINSLNGAKSLAIASKVDDSFIVGYFNVEQLQARFLDKIDTETYQLSLLDNQGRIIFQVPPEANDNSASLAALELVGQAFKGEVGRGSYMNGKTSLLGTAVRVSSFNGVVLLGQKEEGLIAALWRLRIIFMLGFILSVFLAAVWSRALAKRIVRPISQLAESAKSFADGDYRHPLPYGCHKEIDDLSDSFRRMREAVDDREQLLWKNREYFSRLFNGITDAIFIAERLPDGQPGQYVEVNDVACKMLGYTRDELTRLSPLETNRTSIDDTEAFRAILEDIELHGKTLFKTEFCCKDGSWIPVEVSSQIFELDRKRVFFSVARDITLREKYESSIQTLVRSTVGLTGQACLDEIAQNLCDWLNADGASIGLVDGDKLMIQSCCIDGQVITPHSQAITGTPHEMIVNEGFRFIPEDVDELFPALRTWNLTGGCGFIGIAMHDRHGEVLGVVSAFSRTPMRSVPHVEELLSVIASRAAAECERMHYERELSYSEEMLRTLFNSTAEAIVGIDLNGVVSFCNPAAQRILGFEEEGLVGKDFHRLAQIDTEPGEPTAACPFIAAIQQDEKFFVADAVFMHRSGNPLPVEYWGHPMCRDGELVGAVITFLDITQRRTLEKQLQHSQRMEAIGTLTGGIAHDFNNILTVISGYVGLLQSMCQDNEKILPKIDKIAEAAERGSKLTHGLLAYSRKKSGPSTPVDLNRLVLKVQDLFGKVIGERINKNITLADEQLVVLADTGQLEQVLVNLATNARDAMPDGGVLSINTSRTVIDKSFCRQHGYGEPGNYALITVEDCGAGMSKDVLQKIFDPFYTTKDTGKGTGLGLAIAWGIIKQHKGYILVDSEPGQGSRFSIYLPLSNKLAIQQVTVRNHQLPGGTETILLVEDDQLVRESTYSILTAVGYQVITSDCAETALESLQREGHRLSLILSDVVMPGMKGTEFYSEIRKMTNVPVIFISGYTFDALREQGLVGEDALLLNKPIQPVDLLTRIRETLDRLPAAAIA